MRIRYTLRFFLNKKTLKNDKCKIYGRLRTPGNKNEFATQIWIKPEDWNHEYMLPYKNPFIKRELSKIESDIENTVRLLEVQDIFIDAKTIKDYYSGNDNVKMGVIEFFDKIIKQKKKISKTSESKYTVLKCDIQDFIRSEYKSKDMNLKKIDYKFITNLDYYYKSIRSKQFNRLLAQDTIAGKHSYFRHVLRQAFNEDYIRKTPYDVFKIKKGVPKLKYLTRAELESIINLDVSNNPTLSKIKDIFLFTVYTGLRYNQAMMLTLDNIILNDGKYERIYIASQEKNKTLLNIPLLDKAIEIIEKYKDSEERLILNKVLPKFSNTYFNKKIKVIAKMCDIKFNLTHHVARHTLATTILGDEKIDIYEIQKWMGHSSINSTKIYSQVTISRMMDSAEKINSSIKAAA